MALLTQLIEPLQVKVPRVDYIVLERSFALHVSLALIVSALQCQLYNTHVARYINILFIQLIRNTNDSPRVVGGEAGRC